MAPKAYGFPLVTVPLHLKDRTGDLLPFTIHGTILDLVEQTTVAAPMPERIDRRLKPLPIESMSCFLPVLRDEGFTSLIFFHVYLPLKDEDKPHP
jgi:hypothetical protein